ncbi:HLA class II histocompatibility antigen, DQ beta 2 chain-like isoform X2 [Heptranchias perlo]|uniref:HLA class II histocompatibility antigen, DQ beta 2 chain-like isoform X2 n=1 Tax=Heptranchias perlo TaxID=212740 RepID=UPI003559481C
MSRSFCPWGLLWILGLCLLSSPTLALHTVQQIFSIDGSQPPVMNLRFAYNGKELAHFNFITKKLVATSPLLELYVDELNNSSRTIKNLDRYSYFGPLGADIILRVTRTLTAKPSITITVHHLKGEKNSYLNCRVSGFYPRGINTTWLRNGEAVQQEVLRSRILPNKDGSFQVTLQVNVDPRRGDTYTCQVEHRSAPDKLTAVWAPKSQNLLSPAHVVGIISGLAGIIIAVSGGIIRWKGVWLQIETEYLCEDYGQPPSSTPA